MPRSIRFRCSVIGSVDVRPPTSTGIIDASSRVWVERLKSRYFPFGRLLGTRQGENLPQLLPLDFARSNLNVAKSSIRDLAIGNNHTFNLLQSPGIREQNLHVTLSRLLCQPIPSTSTNPSLVSFGCFSMTTTSTAFERVKDIIMSPKTLSDSGILQPNSPLTEAQNGRRISFPLITDEETAAVSQMIQDNSGKIPKFLQATYKPPSPIEINLMKTQIVKNGGVPPPHVEEAFTLYAQYMTYKAKFDPDNHQWSKETEAALRIAPAPAPLPVISAPQPTAEPVTLQSNNGFSPALLLRTSAHAFAMAFSEPTRDSVRFIDRFFTHTGNGPYIIEHAPQYAETLYPHLNRTFSGPEEAYEYLEHRESTFKVIRSEDSVPADECIVVDTECLMKPKSVSFAEGNAVGCAVLTIKARTRHIENQWEWEEHQIWKLTGRDTEGKWIKWVS
jgi:hypothetical protein